MANSKINSKIHNDIITVGIPTYSILYSYISYTLISYILYNMHASRLRGFGLLIAFLAVSDVRCTWSSGLCSGRLVSTGSGLSANRPRGKRRPCWPSRHTRPFTTGWRPSSRVVQQS